MYVPTPPETLGSFFFSKHALELFVQDGSRINSRQSDRSNKGKFVRFDPELSRSQTQPAVRRISRTQAPGRRMSQVDSSGRKISQTQLPGRRISRTKPPMFNKDSRQMSSLPLINAVAARSYNQFIEVENNPFDTGLCVKILTDITSCLKDLWAMVV